MTAGTKAWIAILAAVVLLPVFVRHAIATEIWIFAIFGLGLNLLMGYTGLLSFGQATFFGSAAYVAGYLLKYYAVNVFLALGIAFVVVALAGLGNLLGSIVAGLLVGVAQSLVALFWPEASVAVIFAVMAAVLLVRPQGLFGIR